MKHFNDTSTLSVAVAGGQTIVDGCALESSDDFADRAAVTLRYVDALLTLQAHTMSRVEVPAFATLDRGELSALTRAGRLLSGEELHDQWTEMSTGVESPETLPPYLVDGGTLLLRRPLIVTLGGVEYATDRTEQIWYISARVSPSQDPAALKPGDELRFVPGPSDDVVSSAIPLIEE